MQLFFLQYRRQAPLDGPPGGVSRRGRGGSNRFFSRYLNIRSAARRLPASFQCVSLEAYNIPVFPCSWNCPNMSRQWMLWVRQKFMMRLSGWLRSKFFSAICLYLFKTASLNAWSTWNWSGRMAITSFIFLRSHQSFIFKITSEHSRHFWCNNSHLFLSNIQLPHFSTSNGSSSLFPGKMVVNVLIF